MIIDVMTPTTDRSLSGMVAEFELWINSAIEYSKDHHGYVGLLLSRKEKCNQNQMGFIKRRF